MYDPDYSTVTVPRASEVGLIDLTVTFRFRFAPVGEGAERLWEIVDALDEEGVDVVLTDIERHLAFHLVEEGVDETGR